MKIAVSSVSGLIGSALVPAFVVRTVFGEVGEEALLDGQRALLARLLEARRDTAGAVEGYRQFVRRLDLPGPSQRAEVDEAKLALARLRGRGVL